MEMDCLSCRIQMWKWRWRMGKYKI